MTYIRLLLEQFGEVDYTGIVIVPELIAYATQAHPCARFLCRDILKLFGNANGVGL